MEKEGIYQLQQVVDKETEKSSTLSDIEQAYMVWRSFKLPKALHRR